MLNHDLNQRKTSPNMHSAFEELDYCQTPMGDLMLRRRLDPILNKDVFEVKLGEEFLMSSAFTEGEVQLTRLGLDGLSAPELDVVVGGLGLGYTAATVLDNAAVRSLLIIEALAPVIRWHERQQVPMGAVLSTDRRCHMLHDSFFDRVRSGSGFDPDHPGRQFHAVLLDIDHSPRHVLHPEHTAFYQPEGLAIVKQHLFPGGHFALWSNDPPDDAFTQTLASVFADVTAHVVAFNNPFQHRPSTNTVYVATC
jgi:spermidine synthase